MTVMMMIIDDDDDDDDDDDESEAIESKWSAESAFEVMS
jgi:hypothetical protein